MSLRQIRNSRVFVQLLSLRIRRNFQRCPVARLTLMTHGGSSLRTYGAVSKLRSVIRLRSLLAA